MVQIEPLDDPPNDFIQRLVDVATIDVLHNVRQTYPKLEEGRSPRPINCDQLYITDDQTVYKWASNQVFLFRTFKFLYWLLRWVFDLTSLKPTWHAVLYVDDIVEMGRPICVSDTLVLHCRSIEVFEKLIPYICGPYTRLTIHGGSISLDQLRRLVKDTVRKVEVTAKIELQPDEYDEAVQLIIQHVHGFRDNFDLKSTPQLVTEVKSAVEDDRYFRALTPRNNRHECNLVRWTSRYTALFNISLATNCVIFNFLRTVAPIERDRSNDSLTSIITQFAFTLVLFFYQVVLVIYPGLYYDLKSKPN